MDIQTYNDDYESEPIKKIKPSPYIIYCQIMRPKIKKENSNASFGEIGKMLMNSWKQLDDKKKEIICKVSNNYNFNVSFDENINDIIKYII